MTRYPLTIYFDGSCRLCRSEIENIAARDHDQQLVLVDCSPACFDDSAIPYKRETMMNVIHACDADGNWIRGVDVFIAAYESAGLGWVSKILSHPLLRSVADRAYPWLVRNRYRVSAVGLHRVLNFLTHCAQRKRARDTFTQRQTCQSRVCNGNPAKRMDTATFLTDSARMLGTKSLPPRS